MVWTGPTGASELTNYVELIPTQWANRYSPDSLWIEVHRVLHCPGSDTPDPPRCIDLGDVCATFIRSVLEYQSVRPPVVDLATAETFAEAYRHPPQMQIPIFMEEWVPRVDGEPSTPEPPTDTLPRGDSILVLHNAQIVNHRTNLGTFVLLATPHGRAGRPGNESASKDRLRTAAGLLGALMGRNAVYEPVFDVEINSMGNAVGIRSPTIENPGAFRELVLSESRMAVLELCATRMSSLPAGLMHRVELSLRWLYQAMHELDGVVAFLKYWISVETLAMPDGTDIKPVNQHLAAAYNRSESEARDLFQVGRLLGLRSQIVHDGRTPRIDQHLLAYVEGVYVDVLVHILDGTSNIALKTLERSGFSATQLISRAILGAEDEP